MPLSRVTEHASHAHQRLRAHLQAARVYQPRIRLCRLRRVLLPEFERFGIGEESLPAHGPSRFALARKRAAPPARFVMSPSAATVTATSPPANAPSIAATARSAAISVCAWRRCASTSRSCTRTCQPSHPSASAQADIKLMKSVCTTRGGRNHSANLMGSSIIEVADTQRTFTVKSGHGQDFVRGHIGGNETRVATAIVDSDNAA